MSTYTEHLDYIARMVANGDVSGDWIIEQTQIAVQKRDEEPSSVDELAIESLAQKRADEIVKHLQVEVRAREIAAERLREIQAAGSGDATGRA